MKNQLYIGIMSGTSMDGADAVLIEMQGSQWQGARAHAFVPFSGSLKQQLLDLQNIGENELHRSQMLAMDLAHLYADLVRQLLRDNGLLPKDICAIGCHGQTVRHAPQDGYSVQLVNLAVLAEQTGILTVGDFRSRDLAADGQGAPLVPAFHQALFADESATRVVLNIGGIANISVLPPDGLAFGFDTGAGNMLMDAWVQAKWSQPYDKNGQLAKQGQVLPELLRALCAHPYFAQAYPKSTGRELFSLNWLMGYLRGDENPHDVLRTLLAFSAHTIVDAIDLAAPDAKQVFACGGGVANDTLSGCLKDLLRPKNRTWHLTSELDLNPQWVEAAAFGWLAACWCERVPSNPPLATGAKRAVILGAGHWGY